MPKVMTVSKSSLIIIIINKITWKKKKIVLFYAKIKD